MINNTKSRCPSKFSAKFIPPKKRHQYQNHINRYPQRISCSNVTHKTGRVVVPQSLGIAKRLHGRVRLNDLVLQGPLGGTTQEHIRTLSHTTSPSDWLGWTTRDVLEQYQTKTRRRCVRSQSLAQWIKLTPVLVEGLCYKRIKEEVCECDIISFL